MKVVGFILVMFPFIILGQEIKDLRENVREKRKVYQEVLSLGGFRKVSINEEVADFFVLQPKERELLSLLQGKYQDFLLLTEMHISSNMYTFTEGTSNFYYLSFTSGGSDTLSLLLQHLVAQHKEEIISGLNDVEADAEYLEFILFYVEKVEFEIKYFTDNQKQHELIALAKEYNERNPEGDYTPWLVKQHSSFKEPSPIAFDFGFGAGGSMYTDSLTYVLNALWNFDLDFKFYYYKLFFNLNTIVVFNRIGNDVTLGDHHLSKGDNGANKAFIDFSFGRKIAIGNRLALLPKIGYSLNEFSFPLAEKKSLFHDVEHETTYTFGMNYGLGINYNFVNRVSQYTEYSRFKRKLMHSEAYFRFEVAVRNVDIERLSSKLAGHHLSFNIGIGAHLRGTKKTPIFSVD